MHHSSSPSILRNRRGGARAVFGLAESLVIHEVVEG
jgi:hypothetical protein